MLTVGQLQQQIADQDWMVSAIIALPGGAREQIYILAKAPATQNTYLIICEHGRAGMMEIAPEQEAEAYPIPIKLQTLVACLN